MNHLANYLRNLPASRIVLWCYAAWYVSIVSMYFDPSPGIWLTAIVVSFVIGIALNLSVTRKNGIHSERWQTIRLFLMPFCVSSYSTLIKDRDFIVIFPQDPAALEVATGSCAVFLVIVWLMKKTTHATQVTRSRTPDQR
jgi:hypothetical protein